MLQECLEQVPSVRGDQSPEPFQGDIPTAGQTLGEDLGIQCELLTCKNLPAVKSVGIQIQQTFVTVATQTDVLDNQPTLESVHTQTTDVTMPITAEIVSPQKSIFSELTCTSTDVDSAADDDDDDMYMPVSAESQTESENESEN